MSEPSLKRAKSDAEAKTATSTQACRPPPTITKLEDLYSSLTVDAQRERYDNLRSKLSSESQLDVQFFARSPGRVNLIGEHIDYCGFSVLPMALGAEELLFSLMLLIGIDCVIAVSDRAPPSGKCVLLNVNSNFASKEFAVDLEGEEGRGETIQWHDYVMAAYHGFVDAYREENGDMNALEPRVYVIDGRVPMAAGLSSSSALVCAMVLAVSIVHKRQWTRTRIATIATACERYVGVHGGGMDQAISMLAESGNAKLVSFKPLRTESVNLPDDALFVVMHSLQSSEKAAELSQYNKRVAECRIAAALLLHARAQPLGTIAHGSILSDVHAHAYSDMSLDALADHCAHIMSDAYTVHGAAKQLQVTPAFVWNTVLGRTDVFDESTHHDVVYLARQRAQHVYREAARVHHFHALCARTEHGSALSRELGHLMNESHTSCRNLYDCSCEQLDRLCGVARQHGAYGARLTGAGWGGCAVALVPRDTLRDFLTAVNADFYNGKASAAQLFATAPGAGAAVVRPL